MRFLLCVVIIACTNIVTAAEQSDMDYGEDEAVPAHLQVAMTDDLAPWPPYRKKMVYLFC